MKYNFIWCIIHVYESITNNFKHALCLNLYLTLTHSRQSARYLWQDLSMLEDEA